MRLLHDYILVKEVIADEKIEGTNLSVKYDDTERFMRVEVLQTSEFLTMEYLKYYGIPKDGNEYDRQEKVIEEFYKPGNVLIINRVAKTPYKDGMYFISFKDVIAVESEKED